MTVSTRTRFEVFKRDRFTCAYCGRNPPDVLLHVDHIVPKAAGGTDDITNLTLACQDCNLGKADRLLEEGQAPVVNRQTVDDLRERLEQAAEYTELVGQERGLLEKQRVMLSGVWAEAFGAQLVEEQDGTYWRLNSGQFPNDRSLITFLRRIPVKEIIAAIDITASRFDTPTFDACRFFYKVCWRRIKGESGPIDEPAPAANPHAECVPSHEYWDRRRALNNALSDIEAAEREVRRLALRVDFLLDELSAQTGTTAPDLRAWMENELER